MKLALLLVVASCTTTVTMAALEPAPASTIVRQPSAKTFAFVAGVGDDPACVGPSGGELFCFTGFRQQFEQATKTALAGLLTAATTPADADYRAEVKLLRLLLSSNHGYTVFDIMWSFELTDRSGRVIVGVHDDLESKDSIDYSGIAPPNIVKRMESSILDKIVGAVAQSEAAH